jgi:hypothetical protein
MKKVIALLICALFVLSTTSFALWGIGEKSTKEAKTKVETKVKKEEVKKKVIVKKAKKAKKAEKKGATPAVPPKK